MANKFKDFKELKEFFIKEYGVKPPYEQVFELWKIFLHLDSQKAHVRKNKFKVLTLVQLIEGKLWCMPFTTDQYQAKKHRIKLGLVVTIDKNRIKCVQKTSYIDVTEIHSIELHKAHGQLSKKLIDKNEKLPQEFRDKIAMASGKANLIIQSICLF